MAEKLHTMNATKNILQVKPVALIILLLLFLGVVWSSLSLPMVVNAAKYAQVSREMLSGGDWIRLSIAGEAYDQKPPLLFWIGAVFFQFFGISTPVWKIAFYLVSLLGIWSTYQLGKLLYGKESGMLAALFWACSLSFFYYHNDVHTDTLLADMVIFAIWQLAVFFRGGKSIHFYLGIVGTGLAMLAKGPVGMAIPAMATGLDLLIRRDWKAVFHPRWLIAALIIALMISPALIGLYQQFGMKGITFYFWTNNVGRITGSYYVQNPDPGFYLHTILYMLAPFTIFALAGFFVRIKETVTSRLKPGMTGELFTLGGIVPYLIVLSVSKTKNPHYLMAIVPLFMILAAWYALRLARETKLTKTRFWIFSLNNLVHLALWGIMALFVFWFFPEKRMIFWLIILAFLVLILLSILKFTGIKRQVATLTLSILALMFSLFYSFYPSIGAYHAPFKVAEDFNRQAKAGEQIHLYLKPSRYWEILFYSTHPGRYYVTEDDLPGLLKQNKDWVFTDTAGKDQIINKLPETEIVAEYDHRSLSQATPRFLNPRTRASKLEKRYLLHLP